jgi:hypothetical protein
MLASVMLNEFLHILLPRVAADTSHFGYLTNGFAVFIGFVDSSLRKFAEIAFRGNDFDRERFDTWFVAAAHLYGKASRESAKREKQRLTFNRHRIITIQLAEI